MRSRLRSIAFLAALAGAVALFAVRPVSDTDTFWHLATGRLIVEQGVPLVNTFSSTNAEYQTTLRQREAFFAFVALLLLSLFAPAARSGAPFPRGRQEAVSGSRGVRQNRP